MGKRITKIIGFYLILSLVMQLYPTYASELPLSEYAIRQLMAEQEDAVAANDCIVNGMGILSDGSLDYESDFAGMRIDSNKLVLSLTDCSEMNKKKYLDWALGYEDVIIFEEVEYSYDYLRSQVPDVIEKICEVTGEHILSYYVSEVENNVVVKMSENAQKILNKQRMNLDFNVPVKYVVGNSATTASTEEVVGGAHLQNVQNNDHFSVGCCGYFRGVPSIATCGHSITGVGDQIWVNDCSGGFVGSVVYHNFENGRAGDYAIISGSNSYYEFTNKVGNTYEINGTISNPAVGTYVYFYGNTTQQYCFGRVAERWISGYVTEDVIVREMTCVTVLSGTVQEGDSGGTVFTVDASTNNAKFCGAINAYSTSTGSLEMFFTPASLFTSLGFSVLTN